MQTYQQPLHLRWSDLDPNYHVRHSVYYDWAAQLRTQFLVEHGLTPDVMAQNQLGPVLFREEARFRHELRFGDSLMMNVEAVKLKRDFSRFSFQHQITREGKVCATVTVEGAWIDTQKRKLTVPPEFVQDLMNDMPKAEGFVWEE